MTEIDVSESARNWILQNYHTEGQAKWHFESPQWDGRRPDLLIFIEYHSPRRQWVTHSIESKVRHRYLAVTDYRKTCSGVSQAKSYKANYRWLAISKEMFNTLSDEEWDKLQNDCVRYSKNVGLLVAYKTKVDEIISASYNPGSWIEYYQAMDWFINDLG